MQANQKNSESCPFNQNSTAAMNATSDEKWRSFNCFSVQGTVGSPMGPDPENRVGDQEAGSPGRSFYSGMQVAGEPGHFSGEFPAAFFLQNVPQLHQQRTVILRVDSLALWYIINEEDVV